MTAAYRRYLQLVDRLREMRRDGVAEPELRPTLEVLEGLFAELSEGEQEAANSVGWRGWPDQFDDHLDSLVETRPRGT
jgi:hypothetical protein